MNEKTLVIDNGSYEFKAGFAGLNKPSIIFQNYIGQPKKDFYIGDESESDIFSFNYPIENGIVSNWDNMEKIFNYAFFSKLNIIPEEHPILLTEAALNPNYNRKRLAEMLFEKFNIPAIFISWPGVLALYSTGRKSGIVFDSGHGVTSCIPVYDIQPISNAVFRSNFAGSVLTSSLKNMLNKRGYFLDNKLIEKIKTNLCYHSDKSWMYKLPDGKSIDLNNESLTIPEALFNPSVLNLNYDSVQEIFYKSLLRTEIEFRNELLSNIVLSGGSTLFSDFVLRVEKEINSLVSNHVNLNVIANRNRKFSAWMGGSIFASVSSFNTVWISRKEYEETGSSILFQKCF